MDHMKFKQHISVNKLSEAEKQYQHARLIMCSVDIYSKYPKLYKTLDYVDIIRDERIPTLGISPVYDQDTQKLSGYYNLYWSPTFVSTLSDKQLTGILIHEILHILLSHTTKRAPDFKSNLYNNTKKINSKEIDDEDILKHISWNLATDCAINQLIREQLKDPDSKTNIDPVFPESFTPQLQPNRNSEFYYNSILEDQKKQYQNLKDAIKKLEKIWEDGKLGEHGQWVDSDKNGKVIKIEGKHQGTPRKSDGDIQDKQQNGERDKKDPIRELNEISKELGLDKFAGTSNVTTAIIKLDAGGQKKTPGWMKKTIQASVHGFEMAILPTRKVPSRRYGLDFPGKRRQQVSNKVLVAVDVSGSITMPLYKMFTEHLNNMLRFADFDILFFNSWLLRSDGSTIDLNSIGRLDKFKKNMEVRINGGTDFEPVMQLWNKIRNKYDSLFIFTDGCADYVTPPIKSREVNWIIYNIKDYVDHQINHGNKYYMDPNSGDGLYEEN